VKVFEKTIQALPGGSVLAQCGPMRLVISAFVGRIAQPEMAARAGRESFDCLERVARVKGFLGQGFRETADQVQDPLAARMIESVMAVGDEDLTPMAAVAGTIADAVADHLCERGMTKVVVDNGGDVAVRLGGREAVTVGIRPAVEESEISHVISLGPEAHSWGIATSGLGGRSFTRGIASAATVVARNASLGDAAATAVANASFVDDPLVFRRPARELDPCTDIPDLPVTVKVGRLGDEKKALAVANAIQKANELIHREVILGAFVSVQGMTGMTEFFEHALVHG
jgi:ApbE superfamily uncharacterized protein (UPF0280 family)